MALSEQQKKRLVLAEGLRQLADHSSESELRDALSRSYYSLFHAGLVLLGRDRIRHENLPKALKDVDPELATTVDQLSKLRELADYDPEWVAREFGGDVDIFREKTADALELGRTAYRRLIDEIAKR